MDEYSDVPEDTSLAIFQSLGGPNASLAKKISDGERSIINQQRDVDKLKNRLTEVMSSVKDKEASLKELKEMTTNVQLLMQQMIDWESTLDVEEVALLKEIEKLSTAINAQSTGKKAEL